MALRPVDLSKSVIARLKETPSHKKQGGIEQKDQGISHSPHKYGDWDSNAQNPCKSLVSVVAACSPDSREAETGESLGQAGYQSASSDIMPP